MTPNASGYRMIIAGGGTGGHLFPGIAVAEAFLARHPANRVLFVNAGRPLDKRVLAAGNWPHETIAIEGIKGRGRWRQMLAAGRIPGAIWASAGIIKRFAPHMVLGVGGYSAGPVVAAAWIKGVATALHEQNLLPGATNRLLGRIAGRIYLSFEASQDRFDPRRTVVTGNPVRTAIADLAKRKGTVPDQLTVLIVGGSQGAHAINEAVVAALDHWHQPDRIDWIHQTGPEDEARVARAYADKAIDARVTAFIEDMAGCYQQADIIVCRAGATTVAEITAVGKPAVFIPFPFATDNHQERNAQALVDAGAAVMIRQADLTGTVLAETVQAATADRTHLADMARRARQLGRPAAARQMVDDIMDQIGATPGSGKLAQT